jgi:hydroxymethylglutaryl-CoA lyase
MDIGLHRREDIHFPVLVPNQRGLQRLLELLESNLQPCGFLTDEISVFTSTTDSFSRKNLNCTVAESLKNLESVTRTALDRGLRVRGYLSMVIACPFEGKTDPKRVREVTKQLLDMGCYEVSLGDTVGRGRPHEVAEMLEEVKTVIPVDKLAVSFFSPPRPLNVFSDFANLIFF